MRPSRLLVVDDDEGVRAIVRLYLLRADDIEIVGTAADGPEAVEASRRYKPDLILLDYEMPGASGLESLAEIKIESSESKIVLFSSHTDIADAAMAAGADAFLTKPASHDEMLSTLRALAG